MDYMFYTPINTEPNIDHSVPFDSEIALLEARYHVANEMLSDLEAQREQVVNSDEEISSEGIDEQISNQRELVQSLEQAVFDARAAKEDEWAEHRVQVARQRAEEEGIEVPEVTG